MSTITELLVALLIVFVVALISFEVMRRKLRKVIELQRLAEEKLEIVEHIAEVGTWEIDANTRHVDWSEQVFAIHHRNPVKGPPPIAEALAYYHPDDRSMVAAAVDRTLNEGEDFEFHARIIDDSGRLRHVLSRGAARFRGGKIAGAFGTFIEMRGAWQPVLEDRVLVADEV